MMKRGVQCFGAALFGLFGLMQAPLVYGEGVVVGFDSQDGRVLLGELKCAACHEGGDGWLSEKQAPDLSRVGARVTPQYLRQFLTEPHKAKSGTPMPDVMHGHTADQRRDYADALTHFLVSLGGGLDQRESGANLGEISRGEELFHTIGCVACHQPIADPPKQKIDSAAASGDESEATSAKITQRPSVPLPPLAMKTTVDQLSSFLHDPHKTRPSGRMPSLSLQPGEGRALAAYLLREQYTANESAPGSGLAFAFYDKNPGSAAVLSEQQPTFEGTLDKIDLTAALKMVPTKSGKPPASNFGMRFYGLLEVPVDGEYRFWTRSDDGSILRINGKLVVNNDGNHSPAEKEGRVTLRQGRHPFEVAFMQGGGGFELSVSWQPPGAKQRTPIGAGVLLNQAAAMIPKGIEEFKLDAAKVKQGRELFAKFRCNACHQVDKTMQLVGSMPLSQLNVQTRSGCVGDAPAGGIPQYDFTPAQRQAVRQALATLKAGPKADTHASKLGHALTTLNCYACHQRGDVGGPAADRANYFVYERVVDLGDEGRLPPPLHEVGAKLTDAGFKDMLLDGNKYRTYMATRMPRFGEKNVGHLPALFAAVDDSKIASHEPDFSSRLVDDGRFLIGKKALACINCHTWGEHRLPGAEGMDLQATTRRIKPGWFKTWLTNPQKMRPGTRMPTAWPQGRTFFPDVAGGEMERQIDAVWAYLSVGQKGGFPAGLAPSDENYLEPADQTIVFRTFLNQVSAHAILVGNRQRTHMAFDANRVRSVLTWTGAFVTTKHAWDGRAGQYAQIPGSDVVHFPDAPPFAKLASYEAAWPKDRPKEKLGSNRTPDGWRFRGYRFGPQRVPTFLYDVDSIQVRETPTTNFDRNFAVLTRSFELETSLALEPYYFLAARGQKIVATDDGFVVDDKQTVKITGDGALQPVVRESEGRQELVFRVPWNKRGESQHAKFEVKLTW